jgi:hypothetical protein
MLLQDAPRDEEKLEWLLKRKERENEEATYIEETQRLVTEVKNVKVVLYLVNRKKKKKKLISTFYCTTT